LDGSTSSSDSGDVEFVGTNEKDLKRIREDDVEDDEMLVDQDTFLQARVVAGRARPSPTVNLKWDEILLDGAARKECGGGGACLLLSIMHARFGPVNDPVLLADKLRLAAMDELLSNKEHYQQYCILEDTFETMSVAEYVAIHSKEDAYCGDLEIRACCVVLEVNIKVYSRHYQGGYQVFHYNANPDDPDPQDDQYDTIEIAHIWNKVNPLYDHYQSIESRLWLERLKTHPMLPMHLTLFNRWLGNLHVSSTGTLYDMNNDKVDSDKMKNVIKYGSGIYSKGLSQSEDHILIVGHRPSRTIVDAAKSKNITLTTWSRFAEFACGKCSAEELRAESKDIHVAAYRTNMEDDVPGQAGQVVAPVCQEMTDKFAQTKIQDELKVGSAHPGQAKSQNPTLLSSSPPLLASALKPSSIKIPIDRERLLQSDKTTANPYIPKRAPTVNRRSMYTPANMTHFVTCLLTHSEDKDGNPDEFRKKLLVVFKTIQDHDKTIKFLKSYEDTPGAPDITDISLFPRDWSQMLKYVHLKNSNSLRTPWTDGDGNTRAQSVTIAALIMSSATLIMSSKRDLGKLLNLLSLCFINLNLRLSVKEMDTLDESNIYAIMGVSNLFDNVALHSVLQRELIKKVEKAHLAGAYVNHPLGWENQDPPEFQVILIKCKVPPVSEEITPEP
jgi:hypothetical protein